MNFGRCILAILCVVILSACTEASIFGPIGTNLSDPLMVAVDSAAKRAYLVNANNSYQYDSASLHVIDLTDPTAPVRVGDPVSIPNYSGQIVLDATNSWAVMTNRLSTDDNDAVDTVIKLDLTASPITTTSVSTLSNPFGLALYNSDAGLLVTTQSHKLQFFDSLDSTPALAETVDLRGTLSGDHGEISSAPSTYVDVVGTQAFVILSERDIVVINLNEVGVSGANPVDYYVDGIDSPRGLSHTGDSSRIAFLDYDSDGNNPVLRLIDVSAFPALEGAGDLTTIQYKAISDLETDGVAISLAIGDVGTDPVQIVVNGTTAYITNYGADTVSVVSGLDGTPTLDDTISVGDKPFGMAFYVDGATTYLLVCSVGSDTVSIVNLSTAAVVGTYAGE